MLVTKTSNIDFNTYSTPTGFDFYQLPVTPENMETLLEELNAQIDSTQDQWAVAYLIGMRKAVHLYLGNIDEAISDNRKFRALLNLPSFSWENDSDLIEMAKEGTPIAHLLLKIKGIPLPSFETVSFDSTFSSDCTDSIAMNRAERLIYEGQFKEAIEVLNSYLDTTTSKPSYILQMRGLCKVMIDDYEGALTDYDQIISHAQPFYSMGPLMERAAIHYLNGNPEQARADLEMIPSTRIPAKNMGCWMGQINETKFDAIMIEKILGL